MDFEIEFHPVGDLSKAGDAISVRYGTPGSYRVIIIDGGTDDSGTRLVDHVKNVYGPDTIVSDVINTHPDADHSCGLRAVLKELPVERLWVHGLWNYAPAILDLFQDSRWTADGLAQKIKGEYPVIVELVELAAEKKISINEPFAGARIGPFTVLSPNKPTYQHLIPQFRKTPDPNVDLLKERQIWLGEPPKAGFFSALLEKAADKVTSWISDNWDIEVLKGGGITAAENEFSTVLFGDFGGSTVLLTADAGINALHWASGYAEAASLDILSTKLVQVPHHGSRRNVSPTLLDKIVGQKLAKGSSRIKSAIVSAPKDDEKHPRKMVLNAFLRRGAPVATTQGVYYRYFSGMPARAGEKPAAVFDFFDKVEAYD